MARVGATPSPAKKKATQLLGKHTQYVLRDTLLSFRLGTVFTDAYTLADSCFVGIRECGSFSTSFTLIHA